MEAALDSPRHTRGAEMLLHHCLALGRGEEARPPARVRLEQALGPELAQLLVRALAPGQGRGAGSSSP